MKHILESLRFGAEKPIALNKLERYFCDRNQLTLHLNTENLDKNRQRIQRMKQSFHRVKDALDAAGIEFVVLKGFANWDHFCANPELRIQYDLDLFCPDRAEEARHVLETIGYESIPGEGKFPVDHLPALVQKTGWQWKGDFFDPEMPISVELHFRLWDEDTEGFTVPGIEDFWSRRVVQYLDGRPYLALDPVDSLGYACLHLLRHMLRGDVRAANVYEVAYFLHHNADNAEFWARWRPLHGVGICFLLAQTWFGCRLHSVAQNEIDRLDVSILQWFERYAWSPAETLVRPNKDEIWLHLCLLNSFSKKAKMLLRRLAPIRLPGALDSVFIPDEQLTWKLRWVKRLQYSRYVAERAVFHARALSTMFRMRA